MDRYPISNIENLFAKQPGGKFFSQLDISQAYVSADSNGGRVSQAGGDQYAPRDLPVQKIEGVHSRDFQIVMKTVLSRIPSAFSCPDDILVTSETEDDYLTMLKTILQ